MPAIEHASPTLTEADRLMTVCNSCRYCEGLCAVFLAMEQRRSFEDGDLNYLANLCHGCGACYVDCQFSPPHEFNVNVPVTLARVRAESYASYAWPKGLAALFRHNRLAVGGLTGLSVAVFVAGFADFNPAGALFTAYSGPGAFYALMPHNAMALAFGVVFLLAVIAIILSVRTFWRESGSTPIPATSLWQAMRDASSLRYLDGGGVGCSTDVDKPTDRRKLYHHLTFYGFGLCFAATSIATLYHYLLGREAPYPLWDLPVVLGTLGGIGLIIGPTGLSLTKNAGAPELKDPGDTELGTTFTAMLFLTSATGLMLLGFRTTPAMGVLLALHLGVVMGLFLTLPYGKFVHGIYRFAALVKYAHERGAAEPSPDA